MGMATKQPAATTGIVIGYARVSSDKQAAEGVSLEAQTARIHAMATVQGATLLDVIVDAGESAKTLNRPGMTRLLDMVESRQVQTVIVAKLDRLTRSVRDLADLLERFERRGVALVSVSESLDTGTAAGRLVLNVMMSVAQWEREAIGERTREALRHKKASGQRIGNLPYGYQLGADGRTLDPNPRERRTQAVICEWRLAGFSFQKIADELNRRGIQTRRGTAFRWEYIRSLVATRRDETIAA
jgi:DNA invertase Pin-like site-specific DNA recombinase